MEKRIVKQGYEAAQKELQEEQINRVKEIVKATLKKLEDLKEKKKDIEEQIKILKLDIEDLKAGRLDRIEERQKVDKKAKEVSVVIIEREVVKEPCYPWLIPYTIMIKDAAIKPYYEPNVYWTNSSSNYHCSFSITGSTAKNYTVGTYEIDGKIINLR